MKLGNYLKVNNLTLREFGERIGVTKEAVRLLVIGRTVPKYHTLENIIKATGGAVKFEDFAS